MKYYIAIDIGGTRMRAACYSADQTTPLKINRIKTRKKKSPPRKRINKIIASVWPQDGEVAGIGVAIPGPVDTVRGVVQNAPNIPEFNDWPLTKSVQETFGVPVFMENDANLAALGEWKFGAGRGYDFIIYLTISTGIGSGMVLDGKLFTGAHGFAGELGHLMVEPDGPVCSCGVRGHIEALASGTAISRWVAEQIRNGADSRIPYDPDSDEPIPGQAIAAAAHQGDELGLRAYRRAGAYLGRALADMLHTFNPEIIILGGGVSQSYDLFANELHQNLRAHIMSPHFLQNLKITTAQLGDDAGLMGALVLAKSAAS